MRCRRLGVALLGTLLAACGGDDAGGGEGDTTSGGSTTTTTTSGGSTIATTSMSGSSSDPVTTVASSSGADTSGGSSDSSGTQGSTTGAIDRAPKSVVIAIDGLRSDALAAANTPNLDALRDGTWDDGYAGAYTGEAQCLTDAASLSGPNHWAIMTGATGDQHGVTGNGDVAAGDGEAFPHYLSLLERDDGDRNTAYLYTWGPDGLIPCEADYIRDGDDESNTDRAASIVAGSFVDRAGDFETSWMDDDVDALFLFLDDVDGAGHGNGFSPDVAAYVEAVERADGQVGEVLDAILARATFDEESWQIVVTTDHGGIGTSHGGMTPEELTIPFLVAGRDVEGGALPEGTRNFDAVPTVLEHFDLEIPATLTGMPRG